MRKTLPFLAIILLTGCGSSPKTHFYTLNGTPAATGARAISFSIQVAAVHVPPSLDRRQMVSMSGENSVNISETNRWSAAFDEMVRNILARDLTARLPAGKVILPNAPAPAGTRVLVVTISQFGPDATGSVTLKGSWSLLSGASNAAIMKRDFRINAGSGAKAEAMASAMSVALGRLADQIASTLSRR